MLIPTSPTIAGPRWNGENPFLTAWCSNQYVPAASTCRAVLGSTAQRVTNCPLAPTSGSRGGHLEAS